MRRVRGPNWSHGFARIRTILTKVGTSNFVMCEFQNNEAPPVGAQSGSRIYQSPKN